MVNKILLADDWLLLERKFSRLVREIKAFLEVYNHYSDLAKYINDKITLKEKTGMK